MKNFVVLFHRFFDVKKADDFHTFRAKLEWIIIILGIVAYIAVAVFTEGLSLLMTAVGGGCMWTIEHFKWKI